jgi:hypothetical protein
MTSSTETCKVCEGISNLQYIQARHDKNSSIATEYSISFTIVTCLLMWTVFLRVRTYYGDKTVNKLMIKTFQAATISLILKSVAVVLEVFQKAKLACMV